MGEVAFAEVAGAGDCCVVQTFAKRLVVPLVRLGTCRTCTGIMDGEAGAGTLEVADVSVSVASVGAGLLEVEVEIVDVVVVMVVDAGSAGGCDSFSGLAVGRRCCCCCCTFGLWLSCACTCPSRACAFSFALTMVVVVDDVAGLPPVGPACPRRAAVVLVVVGVPRFEPEARPADEGGCKGGEVA